MDFEDCPYIKSCPYAKMDTIIREESWKILYCFEDSINRYINCARYCYKTKNDKTPPLNLLPDGTMSNNK